MPSFPSIIRNAIAVIFTFVTLAVPAWAQDGDGSTAAQQAIILDYDTGMVLFDKNADARMPTSSMSKVITIYLVFEALENGRLSLDTELPVSEKAWRMGGSKMFVEVDDKVKVEDLIRGVIVQSGNDATIVLAEGLAGTEDAFADALNAKARELGMESSHFANASGWPDPDHYSTARDLAILARAIIADFPDYYDYYSETEFTYNNIRQPNRNPLLYHNIGADGIKTGHTEDGGYGLMASGERDGRRVIMVLNGMPTLEARAQESTRLLDWALRSFENVALFEAGETVEDASVVMGQSGTVPMVIADAMTVTVPKALRNDLKVEIVYNGPLKAPVTAGQEIGKLRVSIPRLTTLEVPLLAGADVPELGFFAATVEKLGMLIRGDAELPQ